MRLMRSERWNAHSRRRGSATHTGLQARRTPRERNFGMESGTIFGMTRAAPAGKPNNRVQQVTWLAGAPGFEPGNGGIKIRCLTTWLRPIRRVAPQAWARLRDSTRARTIKAPPPLINHWRDLGA